MLKRLDKHPEFILLGCGSGRIAYLDPVTNIVYKYPLNKFGVKQQEAELETWDYMRSTKYLKYFAVCYPGSTKECILMEKLVQPVDLDSKKYEEYKDIMITFQPANCNPNEFIVSSYMGYDRHGEIKCCDYATFDGKVVDYWNKTRKNEKRIEGLEPEVNIKELHKQLNCKLFLSKHHITRKKFEEDCGYLIELVENKLKHVKDYKVDYKQLTEEQLRKETIKFLTTDYFK